MTTILPSPVMSESVASCTLGWGCLSSLASRVSSVFSLARSPSCICQPQWKARDTTESGSRFNRFHAISTALWGVCLPLAEERLSHSGGFSSSWYRPTLPVLRTDGGEWSCRFFFFFVPKHSLFPTCVCPQHDGCAWKNCQQRGPDEVSCDLAQPGEKSGVLCNKTQAWKAAFNDANKYVTVIYRKRGRFYEKH